MPTFFRFFLFAFFSWMSFPFVVVAALTPEESAEFDGEKVTDFALRARDGRALDVCDFRGVPVIVEFFASGSSACLAQLKQLIELHDSYADQGLAIFALAVDQFEMQGNGFDRQAAFFRSSEYLALNNFPSLMVPTHRPSERVLKLSAAFASRTAPSAIK